MSANEIKNQSMSFISMVLHDPSLEAMEAILQEKTKDYKSFFYNSPLIINIAEVEDIPPVEAIRELTDKYDFRLVGFSGVTKNDIKVRIFNAGYPVFNAIGAKDILSSPINAQQPAEKPQPKTQPAQVSKDIQVCNGQIRSGMEISNMNGPLLVIGNVPAGSRVIAKQSIIILGNLAGRAYATDPGAHVIVHGGCKPELVAVNGIYKTGEQFVQHFEQLGTRPANVDIHLSKDDEKFIIDPITVI